MPGSFTTTPDERRISSVAAITALAGHAAVILIVLLVAKRSTQVVNTTGVVGVTLVSGRPGGPSAGQSAPTRAPPLKPHVQSTDAPTPAADLTGERLDDLTALTNAPPPTVLTSAASASDHSTASGRPGSSRIDQGLGQGEGVGGVDLYAAASLPQVGVRPQTPPTGDLWSRVAPCWRSAAPREAVLIVELRPDGALAGAPQAVRKVATRVDPMILLAERSALRALQACAPYEGLGGKRWRVGFPG